MPNSNKSFDVWGISVPTKPGRLGNFITYYMSYNPSKQVWEMHKWSQLEQTWHISRTWTLEEAKKWVSSPTLNEYGDLWIPSR
jgi:hypothetical protein